MGIGSQILSRLRNVRMSAREEESAENRLGFAPALPDCSETYVRIGVVIAVRLREVHGRKSLVAEIEWAQGVIFPLDSLVKVHH